MRLLNALNSEDRGVKVRFSLATIAFGRESAQMSQMLSSQGKNAPSDPYPHYLVRLATSRNLHVPILTRTLCFSFEGSANENSKQTPSSLLQVEGWGAHGTSYTTMVDCVKSRGAGESWASKASFPDNDDHRPRHRSSHAVHSR